MNGERSWTRQQYEAAFRLMRRGFDYEYIVFNNNVSAVAVKAADYAFQAQNYSVSGWVSDKRYNRFMVIKWRILSRLEIYKI